MKAKNVKVGVKVIVKSLEHTSYHFGVDPERMLGKGGVGVIDTIDTIGAFGKNSVELDDGYVYDIRDLKRVKDEVKVAVEDEICFSVGDKVNTPYGEFEVVDREGDMYALYKKGFEGHSCQSLFGEKFVGTKYEKQMWIFSRLTLTAANKGDK